MEDFLWRLIMHPWEMILLSFVVAKVTIEIAGRLITGKE